MTRKHFAIISPAWPGEDSGYAIANAASLYHFKDTAASILYFGITESVYRGPSISGVEFIHLPTTKQSKALRFASSLKSKFPAVCQAYSSPSHAKFITDRLNQNSVLNEEITIVFEDTPIACLMEPIQKSIPHANYMIRSHNVLSEAFEGFADDKNVLRALAWKIEVNRIHRFENQLISKPCDFLAISHRDANEYHSRYGIKVDGVIGITLDRAKIERIEPPRYDSESSLTILHLGSLDLRKAHGMKAFINDVFKELNTEFPNMKLVLGGRNSDAFHAPDQNIFGLGFIDSEQEFMDQGAVFLNPQLRGTGVKLKSLIAMGYGKILLSTPKGIEGIDCEDGVECLIYRDAQSAIKLIRELVQQPKAFSDVGLRARNFVLENYTKERK